MKKLFIIGLAAIFCLALAGPTMAAVKMGGSIAVDFGWVNFDKDLAGTDQSRVHFINDKIFTRWNGRFESEDGKLVGMLEIRGGASAQQYSPVTGTTTYNDDINWSYAYIVWRPKKNQSFQIGYQTHLVADQGPGPYPLVVAFTRGTTASGFGELNHAARIVGFRWMTRFSDAVRFELALYDPGNNGGFGDYRDPAGDASVGPVTNGTEENILPMIEAKLPMYFGGARISVAGGYAQQEYKNIGGLDTGAAPKDEGFSMYLGTANLRWPIGIVTLSAEAFYGQNVGSGWFGGMVGPNASFGQPVWNHDTGSFEDATSYGGWAGIQVKLGPGPIGGYFSYQQDEVEVSLTAGKTKTENARTSYGINYILPLGKGFIMRPVINWYDFGDLKVTGSPDVKRGKLMNAGINFQLSF
jgi:hypothetical protein